MVFPSFLRVLVTAKSEVVEINGTPTVRESFDRTDVKFTDILARKLGFTYTLLTAPDGEIGRRLPDGNWTGMVGMVQRNEADIAVSVISVNEQRLQVADFSYPYHRVKITFATRMPEYSPEPEAFLGPFSSAVSTFTLACLFIMPVMLAVLFHTRQEFGRLVLAVYSTLMGQSVDVQPERSQEYIVMTFWKLGITFLRYGYTAVLLSFLTFPPLSGVSTVSELAAAVSRNKYQCTAFPGSFLIRVLSNSPDPKDRIIGLNLIHEQGTRDIDGYLSNRKSRKKPVFIGGEDFFQPLKAKYFISEDEFLPALRAIALTKGFCCKAQLDDVIAYIWASGIYQKLNSDAIFLQTLRAFRKSPDLLQKNEERPLTLDQFEGAFIVLAIGHGLGILAFIFELSPNVLAKMRRRYGTQKRITNLRRLKRKKLPRFQEKRKHLLPESKDVFHQLRFHHELVRKQYS